MPLFRVKPLTDGDVGVWRGYVDEVSMLCKVLYFKSPLFAMFLDQLIFLCLGPAFFSLIPSPHSSVSETCILFGSENFLFGKGGQGILRSQF